MAGNDVQPNEWKKMIFLVDGLDFLPFFYPSVVFRVFPFHNK